MDYGIVGSIFTVLVFVIFIGIVLWAYSKHAQKGFEQAANLVFDDEVDTNSVQHKRESSAK